MATQNLLSGGMRGSVGQLVGQQYKGLNIVKTKSLNNTAQRQVNKDSFAAFSVLNRIASALAKQWYYWLGLTPDNTLKHNQVAKLLKACVATHQFDIKTLGTIFTPNPEIAIDNFTNNFETGEIRIRAHCNLQGEVNVAFSWIVLVIDKYGYIYYSGEQQAKTADITFFAPTLQAVGIQAITLASVKDLHEFKFTGFNLAEISKLPIVVGTTMFPKRMEKVTVVYEGNGIIGMSGNIDVLNGKLTYPIQ